MSAVEESNLTRFSDKFRRVELLPPLKESPIVLRLNGRKFVPPWLREFTSKLARRCDLIGVSEVKVNPVLVPTIQPKAPNT